MSCVTRSRGANRYGRRADDSGRRFGRRPAAASRGGFWIDVVCCVEHTLWGGFGFGSKWTVSDGCIEFYVGLKWQLHFE